MGEIGFIVEISKRQMLMIRDGERGSGVNYAKKEIYHIGFNGGAGDCPIEV